MNDSKKIWLVVPCFLIGLIILIFVFSLLGRPNISWRVIFNQASSQDIFSFWNLRLPRFILAFMIGASLSVAGASFQSLLKNPLADPYILGVSGGAALGYILALIFGLPFFFVPVCGFVFALLSLILVYRLAVVDGVLSVVSLLLTGIVFNAFSFALILVINSAVNFGQAQQILYLLLGNLDPISWPRLGFLTALLLAVLSILIVKSRALNLLSLGDEEAFHLGVSVQREKKIIFIASSLLVGASVSLCGLIGFVGLIVPHLSRLVFGADNRVVLPASVFIGGFFLVVCEFVVGNLFSFETLSTRLPVGATTALIGAPVFVYLLKKFELTKS